MGRAVGCLAWCLLAASFACGAAPASASGPLQIEVTGGADRQGEIVFSFAEDGAEAIRIPVSIPKGTPENNVARRIRKELRRALSKNDYGIELEGGETVLLSGKGHAKRFVVHLVRNTVDGTEISIARE